MNISRKLNKEKIATIATVFIIMSGILYGLYWGFQHVSYYSFFVDSALKYLVICAVSGLTYFMFYIGGALLIIYAILAIIKKSI